MQNAWRKYALGLNGQLGLLAMQFDSVLKERKSPDTFLNSDDKKVRRRSWGALLWPRGGAAGLVGAGHTPD